MPGRFPSSTRSSLAAALLIAIGYYVGARLGFALTLAPVPVSVLWPPNAILLSGLVLTPMRAWPVVLTAVLGAHLAVQFQSGVPPAMVLCWYISNCLEALIGARLLIRFSGVPTFQTFRSSAIFFACAGVAAPFISSFVDAGFVALNGWGDASYWSVWRARFFANVLAELTLVPVIVLTAINLERVRQIPRRSVVEAGAGLSALIAVCWVVFVRQQPGPGTSPALLYTPVPLLVTAAVRSGPWGGSVAILTCALVAIWGATLGQGPFVASTPIANALSIQLFLIVAWIPVMSLAAVIRERWRAEAKARSSEEQLAIAIDAAQLGRWEWDIASGHLSWCAITRRIYEVPLDVPVSPATFERLVHPDDRPLIAAAVADAGQKGSVDVEFRVRFPDGRIKWILSKGRMVCDEEGRPSRIIGVKVDVTERKLAEMQIHEQRRKLAQRSPVSVAGELSVALAHEVNQPLAAILANASAARGFLLHNPPDLNEISAIVDAIADDNRRAASVISRFGELLRKNDTGYTTLDINDVVRGALDIARVDVISHGVSMTTRLSEGLPKVLGDAVQLQQVLLNLILNACDAEMSMRPEARQLVVATEPDGDEGVRVKVSDNGPGIRVDMLDQIFEPFVSSKGDRLGLGLAVCRSILSAHNGRLCAANHPNGGAVFAFSIPAASAANIVEPAAASRERLTR